MVSETTPVPQDHGGSLIEWQDCDEVGNTAGRAVDARWLTRDDQAVAPALPVTAPGSLIHTVHDAASEIRDRILDVTEHKEQRDESILSDILGGRRVVGQQPRELHHAGPLRPIQILELTSHRLLALQGRERSHTV